MRKPTLLLLLFIGLAASQQTRAIGSSRRVRFPAGKSDVRDFNCPEDFGYYPHSNDCSQYYVCVFGGALLESCTGGLMYSHELQTCDWPRNVLCSLRPSGSGVSTVRVTDPRTQGGSSNIRTATESLTPSVSNVGRRHDNSIQSSHNTKFPGKLDEPTKTRQSRFFPNQHERAPQQSLASPFQPSDSFVQETTNRAINVFATTSRPVFPPSSRPRVPSTTEDQFSNYYNDFTDLGDSDFYYYYDELLLFDDFYDSLGTKSPAVSNFVSSTSAPPVSPSRSPSVRQPSRTRTKVAPSTPVAVDNSVPSRPTPVSPQPPVDSKAGKCDPTVCQLPDCYCGGKAVPDGHTPESVPQIVLLTFDDAVNDLNKRLYRDLFDAGRKNPNGCDIAATFYVSHEWTDYSQVQNLYAKGHEMASHSVSHSFGEQFSTKKWAKEITGQREILSAYGGVRMEDVRGMRAPFLAIGGNKMFKMLHEQNFTYDSSMPVYENKPPSWPYTLDYRIFHDCMIPPCPTNSYPGVWEVPMVMWQDLNGGRCSMGDACTTPPDAEGVYKMLIQNFERHYTTNRAPFGLYYHAAWFTTPHHKEGFIAFLDTITAMNDVWIITNWQALQWVRNPLPLSQIHSYQPWQCNYPERPQRCTSPKVCNVWHKGGVRYMRTCQQCPDSYPWTGSTGVQSPLNGA